jgi:hypothetical protein
MLPVAIVHAAHVRAFLVERYNDGVGRPVLSLRVGLITCRTVSDKHCRSAYALYHSIVALPSW